MNDIFKTYKELRFININNISDRLLEATKNDLFVVYDTLRDEYQVHSILSFRLNGISINSVVDEESLNGDIISTILSSNIKRFGRDIKSDRDYINNLLDTQEKNLFKYNIERGRKMIEASLGREV